jgi:hypothetical protein
MFFLSCNLFSQDIKLRENFNDELSGIIGSFTSSNLFLTFLSQDLIYKSNENVNLTDKQLKVILTTLNDLTSQIDLNLKNLYQIVESEKDAELVLNAISIFDELNLNNQYLIKYIENKNDENKEKFLIQHKKVWQKLENIKNNS